MTVQGGPRPNLLAYGDNLDVLAHGHVARESVDLVYLDPPFNSKANYNVLFDEKGVRAAAQIKAFGDTWSWNTEAIRVYQESVESGGVAANALRAFWTVLGPSDMLAYLSMMAPRLVALHRVLKPTGSLVLHCDPTASAYLKVLLDAIFGPKNFAAEIVWRRTNARSTRGRWPRLHDTLFHYSRNATFRFNVQTVPAEPGRMPHTLVTGPDGLKYQSFELTAPGVTKSGDSGLPWRGFDPSLLGRHWANTRAQMDDWDERGLIHWARGGGWPRRRAPSAFRPEDRRTVVGDVWTDIDRINQSARERSGFPTQKPQALLERIIAATTNPGDVVLDAFCGCGTTIMAAQAMDRRWIGIDITHLAIGLIKSRLVELYGPEVVTTFRVVGEPSTVDDASVLAREDPFAFQAWALGLVGGRVAASSKPGGDGGVDGRVFFHTGSDGASRQVIVSVKGGVHLVPGFVRELATTVRTQGADLGLLISLETPTTGMYATAAEAGFLFPGGPARIQLRTIAELLSGRGIEYPVLEHRRDTLWRPDEVPASPRQRRSRPRRGIVLPTRSHPTTEPPREHPLAEQLREQYADAEAAREATAGRPVRKREISRRR